MNGSNNWQRVSYMAVVHVRFFAELFFFFLLLALSPYSQLKYICADSHFEAEYLQHVTNPGTSAQWSDVKFPHLYCIVKIQAVLTFPVDYDQHHSFPPFQ